MTPEFTILRSDGDPGLYRNFNHPNHPLAPRPAVRWRHAREPLDQLNAWLTCPPMKAAIGYNVQVTENSRGERTWTYTDSNGKTGVHFDEKSGTGTTRPLLVGQRSVLRATAATITGGTVRWTFASHPDFAFSAQLQLPAGNGDPEIRFELTPRREAFYSIAFTGSPDAPLDKVLPIPQECSGRANKQYEFVFCEADLKLPRVQITTAQGSIALAVDPRECRFVLPTLENSRFGLMLAHDAGRLRPVLLAPLLGGLESRMKPGQPWAFTFRVAARAGNWQEMYRHIAQDIHGFKDQRDASGPGSLNACLERAMDFLSDRNGKNHALWQDEQKYFDYFTDQTGVFKPFSPMPGLSAAVVTDDEDFFRRRARPAVEFALSRKYNLFAPYEGINRKIVGSAARAVGGPYVG